jgi:hypothetical protein
MLKAWTTTGCWRPGMAMVLALMMMSPNSVLAEPQTAASQGEKNPSAPSVLTVAPDKSAMFSSIQAAIDAAPVGATIRIAPGVYREQLTVKKALTLAGAGCKRTTVLSRSHAAEQLHTLRTGIEIRLRRATSDEQRQAIEQEFRAMASQMADTLLVIEADGVTIRGMAFSSLGVPREGGAVPIPIVRFHRARVKMVECMVIDGPGDGIHVTEGARAEISHCLVAAVWGTGIVIGDRQENTAGARVIDCDVRNCHYAGIRIVPGCDASTLVQACRISGAAWHGLRYDHASPTIRGNLIFANARCGIYASGDTSASVQENLFFQNEMGGMSCWSGNQDRIEKNTFAGNLREAVAVIAPASPLIRKNIFFGHPKAVAFHLPSAPVAAAADGAEPRFTENLFWQNELNAEQSTRVSDAQTLQYQTIKLVGQHDNRVADPLFTDAGKLDFSLAPGSPARQAGIGAAAPLASNSPWPLQASELAIIPDTGTRDYQQWKRPTQMARPQAMRRSAPGQQVKIDPADLPSVMLLYHRDAELRIQTVQTLSAHGGAEIVDDLIRAHSVENYTPVHNAYGSALSTLTGQRSQRDKGQWKAWLADEVKAGRLQIDYLPLDLDSVGADQRAEILPFATRLEPELFKEMVSILQSQARDRRKLHLALRHMVANDHRKQVQDFLGTDWLGPVLGQGDVNINIIAYQLNGLANPGPLRDKINAQVMACLDDENTVVAANALHLLAGVKGFSTIFTVPGAKAKVTQLVDHQDEQVATQARRALEKNNPPPQTRVSSGRPQRPASGPPKPLIQVSEADRQLPLHEIYRQAQQFAQNPDQRELAIARLQSVLEVHRSNEGLYQSALRDLARCYEDAGLTEAQIRFFAALAFRRDDQGRQEVLREVFQRFSRKRPDLVQAIFAEMRGDSEQKIKAGPARPARPSEELVQGILQRKDKDLRQRSLAQVRDMLAPTSSTEQQQAGLATLRASLTAKFERDPFRPLVLPLLTSDDARIKTLALGCVPALNGTADDLGLIIRLAEDPSSEVRAQVGSALISLGQGEHGDQVIPALTKLLQDSDKKVIERTLRSMWGQYSSPAFDALLIRLSRDPQHHGHAIYHALSTMRSKSIPVCRRLIEELDESNWNDSGRAAWGLTYGVVDEAKSLVEQGLLAALPEETNDYTRNQAFRALRRVATERSRAYLKSVVDSPMEAGKFKEQAREILQDLDRRS